MEQHFEPEPVEDLDGADYRETREQTHHSPNPGYLVWQGHLGVSFDLEYVQMHFITILCMYGINNLPLW